MPYIRNCSSFCIMILSIASQFAKTSKKNQNEILAILTDKLQVHVFTFSSVLKLIKSTSDTCILRVVDWLDSGISPCKYIS